MAPVSPPIALTIAGSDSGGGAGIQADLRTFAFHQVHGTSALTCITAQNTVGVDRVDALPDAAVTAQIQAVVSDMGVQGIKTGMLLNQEIIQAVTDTLEHLSDRPAVVVDPVMVSRTGVQLIDDRAIATLTQRLIPLKQLSDCPAVVVDPVMVSRTGVQLIDDRAIATLTQRLIPLATILTPNRYEAQLLSGLTIETLADMEAAARKIHQLGPQAVLVKGGGMADDLRGVDVWFDGKTTQVLRTTTVDTSDTHGTGCTLSAAIAANLAQGKDNWTAVQQAKDYVTTALQHALRIGQGQGPVGHFFPLLR